MGAREDLVAQLAGTLDERAVRGYTRLGIRTRSPLVRDVLEAAGETAALGWVTALGATPDAHERGLELLDTAVDEGGVQSIPDTALAIWGHLLLHAGRDEDLRRLVDDPDAPLPAVHRWMLRADLLNPHRTAGGPGEAAGTDPAALVEAEEQWLQVFNEIHEPDGLEPVRLLPGTPGSTPYQRLDAPVDERVDGDLVSVVMSAYNPDRDLLTAVRGVLDQTWHNVELLVIDDASPQGSEELLEEAGAMDPRVRIVRAPRNGGTYEARNIALSVARGRWLTFQDSDDWTHPRRIEHQVRHLLDTPQVLANRTWTLRAFPDMTMTYVGYEASRLNASSLLYDLRAVTDLVGHWDTTRKTGDVELPLRLEAVRPGSVRDLKHPAPLAITQLRAGSLSRNDSVPGWIRWDRLAYRDSFTEWHQQAADGRTSPVLPAPDGRRPFPLPRSTWESDRALHAPERPWDVVVLADFRPMAQGVRRSLGVARTASDAGLRTAAAHAETPRRLRVPRAALVPELATQVRQGHLGLTNVHEDEEVGLLVVTSPDALLHVDDASLRVGGVLVVADEAEAQGWSVATVDERCRELFGRLPLWGGPAHLHDADDGPSAVRRAVPDERWCGEDLAVVSGVTWPAVAGSQRAPVDPTRAVVVGHHLDDLPRHWPKQATEIERAHPRAVTLPDGSQVPLEVHTLAPLTVVSKVLGRRQPPPRWLSLSGTGMTVREYLSHLDVWVHLGRWSDEAELGALEALAAGLPCVLHADAAVSGLQGPVRYVEPGDTPEAIAELLPGAHTSAGTTGDTSAQERQAEWSDALRRLMGTPAR